MMIRSHVIFASVVMACGLPLLRADPPATQSVTAAADAAGREDIRGPVELTLDPAKSAGHVIGTLRNTSDRAIVFTAYIEGRREQDAGDTIRTPLHSADVFDASRWVAHPLGWCGTETGQVTLEPGKSAHVQLMGMPRSGIVRARIHWSFKDTVETRIQSGGEAVSKAITLADAS